MATNTNKRNARDMIAPPPSTTTTIVCSSSSSSGRSAVDGASFASTSSSSCDVVRDVYLTKIEREVALLCTQGYEMFHQGRYSQSSKFYQRALQAVRVPLDGVGTAIDTMTSARMFNPTSSNGRTCSCGCGYSQIFCPSLMIDPRLSELHKVRFVSSSQQDKETAKATPTAPDHDGDLEMSPSCSTSSSSSSSWAESYCKPLPFPVQFFFRNDGHDEQGQHITPPPPPPPSSSSSSSRRLESYRHLKNRAATLSLFVVFNIANVLQRMALVEEEENTATDSPALVGSSQSNSDQPNYVMLYQFAYKMSCLQETDDDFDTTWMASPKQVRSFITCQKRILLTILNNLGQYVKMTTSALLQDPSVCKPGKGQEDKGRSRQFFEHLYQELLRIHQEPEGTTSNSNRISDRGPTLHDFINHEPDFDLQGLVDCIVVELRMLSPSTTAPAPAA